MAQDFKELAERLRGLRDACGYTAEEMADMLKIDIETYS